MDAGYYKKYEPIFGAWKIKKKLGEGNFGSVFEIEREDFGAKYYAALKAITIPKTQAEMDSILDDGMDRASATEYLKQFVEKIVGEFVLMSKLKGNSHIVSYEDHRVIPHEDGIGWDILIRMELLTPITSYMKTTTLTKRDVIKLGIDMCKALELCQKYNIIHRDIKPENIFISDSGDFKLGDFGIAREVEKTQSGMTKTGTQTYMAPEVYKGQPYGSSVDIYSLGIVLYRLLNHNRAPFMPQYPKRVSYSDKERALIMRMGGHEFPMPSDTGDSRLAEIAIKAASFRPEDRYSSPTQMREDLEAILYTEGEGILMFPGGDNIDLKSVHYVSNSKATDATEIIGNEDTEVMDSDATEVMDKAEPHSEEKSRKKAAVIAVSAAVVLIAAGTGAYMLSKSYPKSDSLEVVSRDAFADAVEFTIGDGNIAGEDYDIIIKRLEAYGTKYYAEGGTIVMERSDLGEDAEEIFNTINMLSGRGIVKISDENMTSEYTLYCNDIIKAEYSDENGRESVTLKMTDSGADKLNKLSENILSADKDNKLVLYADDAPKCSTPLAAPVTGGEIKFESDYARAIKVLTENGILSQSYEIRIDEKYGLSQKAAAEMASEYEAPTDRAPDALSNENMPPAPKSAAKSSVKTSSGKESAKSSSDLASSQPEQVQNNQSAMQQASADPPLQQQNPPQQSPAEQSPPPENNAGMPEIYVDFD